MILGRVHHSGSNRISLDVSDGPPAVRSVHRNRIIPGLPEMAGRAAVDVDKAGKVGLDPSQRVRHCTLVGGFGDEMEMIRHQAIAPDRKSILLRVSCQQIQEYDTVGVGVENLAPIIAALCNVVRHAGNDESLAPWHP